MSKRPSAWAARGLLIPRGSPDSQVCRPASSPFHAGWVERSRVPTEAVRMRGRERHWVWVRLLHK